MSYSNYDVVDSGRSVSDLSRSFFSNVYKYMFFALALTGGVAYFAAESDWYINMMFTRDGISGLGYLVFFSPLIVVIALQAMINRISLGMALFMFVAYSILLALSLAPIFLIYTQSSIALTFLVTAGAFGSMAVLGYFTKTDLSKMGSLLYMLFFGMVIASLVNFFMESEAVGYIISFCGLFVFTGLTAWEMQRMKAVAQNNELTGENRRKAELLGGLTLYVLFINLFLSILRFVGDR